MATQIDLKSLFEMKSHVYIGSLMSSAHNVRSCRCIFTRGNVHQNARAWAIFEMRRPLWCMFVISVVCAVHAALLGISYDMTWSCIGMIKVITYHNSALYTYTH